MGMVWRADQQYISGRIMARGTQVWVANRYGRTVLPKILFGTIYAVLSMVIDAVHPHAPKKRGHPHMLLPHAATTNYHQVLRDRRRRIQVTVTGYNMTLVGRLLKATQSRFVQRLLSMF